MHKKLASLCNLQYNVPYKNDESENEELFCKIDRKW